MVEYGFEGGKDYETLGAQKCATNNPKNPVTLITDHALSLDMAKEIAMIQRTPKGKEVRQYFIEAEKRLRLIQSRSGQLGAQSLQEKYDLLYDELVTLQHELSLFRAAVGSIPIQQAAIKYGRGNIWKGTEYQLIDLMMTFGIFQKAQKRRYLVVYKKYFDRGLFDWPVFVNGQPKPLCKSDIMLTPAGFLWLADILTKLKEARDNPLLAYGAQRGQLQNAFRTQLLPY